MPVDRIYVLGPEGTFSGMAARRFRDYVLTGDPSANVEITYTRRIPEALELASQGPTARAVAPIENSESGIVTLTQDYLARFDLFIDWEIDVRVRYRVISDVPLSEAGRLYVHPVALEQCLAFVGTHLSQTETTLTQSNVDSAETWSKAPLGARAAALIPFEHRPQRPPFLDIPDVQNDASNTTRFIVVRARRSAEGDFSRKKTSLLITPDADRPGLLHEILGVFQKNDINLCRIESRPARTHNWAYVFHMDITNNGRSADALRELSLGRWQVKVLGTFDELPDKSFAHTGRI